MNVLSGVMHPSEMQQITRNIGLDHKNRQMSNILSRQVSTVSASQLFEFSQGQVVQDSQVSYLNDPTKRSQRVNNPLIKNSNDTMNTMG